MNPAQIYIVLTGVIVMLLLVISWTLDRLAEAQKELEQAKRDLAIERTRMPMTAWRNAPDFDRYA